MIHEALKHEQEDDVAVVIRDVPAGTPVRAVTLDGVKAGTVEAAEDIPLGHKIAVRDLAGGKEVVEYGRPIGITSRNIKKGAQVHTHNLKSLRWGK